MIQFMDPPIEYAAGSRHNTWRDAFATLDGR